MKQKKGLVLFMDIYLDFEATQYKENIIAIGAHCVNGDFDCLVQPPKGDKVTNFITQLTGISKQLLVNAPTTEWAFYDLYNWLMEVSEGPVFFHVYGDMDKIFLKNTAETIENPHLKDFVLNLSESVIDDSVKVQHFFHTKAIGVYKALRYFIPELGEQDHDPLNDAIVLARLMNYVSCMKPPEDCPFEEYKPQPKKSGEKVKRAYTITITHMTDAVAKPKTFNTCGAAISWAYQKIRKNNTEASQHTVQKHVLKAIENSSVYMGWRWQRQYQEEK